MDRIMLDTCLPHPDVGIGIQSNNGEEDDAFICYGG